jgi:hypothetical protein
MIHSGDNVGDHYNIRGRGRGRGQIPWSTQQQKTERTRSSTALKFSILNLVQLYMYVCILVAKFMVGCRDARARRFRSGFRGMGAWTTKFVGA